MSSFMDNLADSLREWTNTATQKAGEFTKVAASKAEVLSKIGRLKMDVFQLQREQNREFAALGRAARSALDAGNEAGLVGQPEVAAIRKRITELDKAIEKKNEEIKLAYGTEGARDEKKKQKVEPEKPTRKHTAGGGKKSAGKKATAKKKATAEKNK
ncbi:MAG: hypothetical protein KAU50_02260 [Candidatus Marinimicrobia bacterium]|nr:hypothetical protein [Candidatus Neomarinimicrobiota bacterium]